MINILCIEDDYNSHMLLKMYFKNTAFKAEVVANGNKAVERLQMQSFDIILTDWNLDVGPSGEALIDSLHAHGHLGKPIVVYTADSGLFLRELRQKGKVQDVFHKPVLKNEMLARLTRLLTLVRAS